MSEPSIRSAEGATKLRYRAETWTLGYSRTSWTAEAPGTIDFAYTPTGWQVTNNLPFDLEQAGRVAYNRRMVRLGLADPGDPTPPMPG